MKNPENLYYNSIYKDLEHKLEIIKKNINNHSFILNLKVVSFLDKNFILIRDKLEDNQLPANQITRFIATSDYQNENFKLKVSLDIDKEIFNKESFLYYGFEKYDISNVSVSIPTIKEIRFKREILEKEFENNNYSIKDTLIEISDFIKRFTPVAKEIEKNIFQERIKFNDRFYIKDFNKEIVDFILLNEDININPILDAKNKFLFDLKNTTNKFIIT